MSDSVPRAARSEQLDAPATQPGSARAVWLIPVFPNAVALVDAEDVAVVSSVKWRLLPGDHGGYAASRNKANVLMHRLILQAKRGEIVDHANRDKLDNRRANLRLATAAQNTANSAIRRWGKTSQYKGVRWIGEGRKKPWRAETSKNQRRIHLGNFVTEIEAGLAYDAYARGEFGEFARLNFPDALALRAEPLRVSSLRASIVVAGSA